MPRHLGTIAVAAAFAGLIAVSHYTTHGLPNPPMKPTTTTVAHVAPVAIPVTGTATVTTCSLTAGTIATPTKTTRPASEVTPLAVTGTLTNTTHRSEAYVITIAATAGPWATGGTGDTLTDVPAGATVSWSATGMVSGTATQPVSCAVTMVSGTATNVR